jgi:fucose permease
LARSRVYWSGFTAVIISSAGWSALINVGNTLTPVAFTPVEYPGSMAFAQNLGNVFFGAGAFLTPLVIAVLLRRASFTVALSTLAVIAAVPAALALGVDFASLASASSATASETATSPTGFGTLLRDPVMWLCGFTLFFYAPLEACTSAWATTYLGERGVAEATAAKFLSAFWLTFMAARLITALASRALPAGAATTLICVMSVLCVCVLIGFVLSRTGTAAIAMVVAAGLVFGPIFPTLVAVLFNHFEPSVRGRAIGLLFGIGGVGWSVVPMLLGAYASRTSVQRGFSVAVGSAIGLTVVALVLARLQ